MKFSVACEPGSRFRLLAGMRDASRATKLTILESIVTEP